MKIKPLLIGNTQVSNNVFLAPMAGYTDFGFRKLMISLGVGYTFTELVSAKGLIYGSEGSRDLLRTDGEEQKTAVQLFGSDPYFMRKACESQELAKFSTVDINMGCPVPKVYKNGEGSALLNDVKKAEEIVKECFKSGKNITVKIRTGLVQGDDIASEFALMAENSGAKLITIHGRVREAYYSGEPEYKAIEKAKSKVNIPVIANGGIFTVLDAEKMMDRTGADGIMIARGAFTNPFLVCELLNKDKPMTLKQFILMHLSYLRERLPDKNTAMEFRKFVPLYFKGMNGLKELKTEINSATETERIRELLDKNL